MKAAEAIENSVNNGQLAANAISQAAKMAAWRGGVSAGGRLKGGETIGNGGSRLA